MMESMELRGRDAVVSWSATSLVTSITCSANYETRCNVLVTNDSNVNCYDKVMLTTRRQLFHPRLHNAKTFLPSLPFSIKKL
jgi:hypothetical protein